MKRFTISKTFLYAFVSLYTLLCLAPMVLTLMVSLTDESTIMKNGLRTGAAYG